MCLFCSRTLHSENLFQQLHADNQYVNRMWKRNLANFQRKPREISEFSVRIEHCASDTFRRLEYHLRNSLVWPAAWKPISRLYVARHRQVSMIELHCICRK